MLKRKRSKRKRNDETPNVPAGSSSQNLTYAEAEALVRRVITQYNIDPTLLESDGPSDLFSLFGIWFADDPT